MSWTFRPGARAWRGAATSTAPASFHANLPGYAPTPLVELPALAIELGVGRVLVKDESERLGLPSFKILGTSWAVHRLFAEGGDAAVLVTASEGNHGRALARVARQRRLAARVFVPDGVHPLAVAAIEDEGATVIHVAGSYEDAVSCAAAETAESGAALVQDTAWAGYTQVPGWIVEGYRTLFAEIDAQLVGSLPDLVVVPVGVGSLAQAAVTHYRREALRSAPALMSVEPHAAAGVLASLVRGSVVTVQSGTTIMAGLNCATPSSLAWPVLSAGLDAACAISDNAAAVAVQDLAFHGVTAGPCGAASLASARLALSVGQRRAQLSITSDSVVVLLSSEGSTANPNGEAP